MALRAASVLAVSDKMATVALHDPSPLPAECDLYFTYNCTVGRKCLITKRRGDTVTLAFIARLGSAIGADNDNVICVD
jgi:hypothetical protein